MSIIKVENLTFSYPSSYDNVFEDVNFQIDTDWKLGFVGRNGRGKTTFLNLLLGKYDFSGKIISSVKFDYFPYLVSDKNNLTEDILREVCPDYEEWRIMREFSYLEVDSEVLYRPFNTLSNGEQAKVLLAAMFTNEGHFLLIDEPTNHLDEHARRLLSSYLCKKKSFMLVSHDKYFLDGCVDHILSLNKSNIEVQKGNFSDFMQNFERQQEFERKENARLQSDIARLQETARQTAGWAASIEATKNGTRNSGLRPDRGFIGHKSAKMMSRAKAVEGRRQKEINKKAELLKNVEVTSSLKLSPLGFCAEKLVKFISVAPEYNGVRICQPVSYEILRGDRIALVGKNGCGKSSILKLLLGQKINYSGGIQRNSNLIISYVPQDVSFLRGSMRNFATENNIDESLFMAVLHKMGVDKDQFNKDLSAFSEGQKKKVLIAKSLCQKAHLYVWDEPLNFIDIFSRIQIENLLEEFQPTMIFVEHDVAFQQKIATKIINL